MTVAFGLALALLLGLGSWQVQRLSWKRQLIATIQARSQAKPVTLPADTAIDDDWNFRAMRVHGFWLAGTEQFMPAKVERGELGEALLQVLALDDGRNLLVNRGWVPPCWRADTCRPPSPAEAMTIHGVLRVGFAPGMMTPANEPDNSSWYWIDLQTIQSALDIGPLVPAVLYASDAVSDAGGRPVPPVPQLPALNLPNDHLQYAVTWYGLAAVLVAIYIVAGRRRAREQHQDHSPPADH